MIPPACRVDLEDEDVLAHARLTESSLSHVGGILEDPPHCCSVPVILASRAENFAVLKLATDLADRATVQRNPRKDLPNDFGLSLHNLIPCEATRVVLPDVTIAVRRTTQDVHNASLRSMSFSSSAPFQNFGTLIFCHHPLNLEQQILLGRPADVMIEESDLDAMSL